MFSRFIITILFSVLLAHFAVCRDQQRTELVMRNIGHHLLLSIGDSSTVLKPIVNVGNQYRIDFTTEFAFEPSFLASVVDSVMSRSNIASKYRVAMVPCAGHELVYGYEVGTSDSVVPCLGRPYPTACYSMLITLLDADETNSNQSAAITSNPYLIIVLFLVGALITIMLLKRNKLTPPNATETEILSEIEEKKDLIISLGNFLFDPKNLTLTLGENSTELTGKECDLLALLIQNLNETVERDTILNRVWGDDGDYIGRTLDVFISKLRKKLEADPNVRILSIRGVGYKLILNN